MSLATRAVIAILLMIGFYALALGVVGALLWIPYAEWTYADRVDVRILLFCVVSALVILGSLLPRRDHFEAPGILIQESQQPALFAELSRIAQDVSQELPHEIYLVPDVNAWVAQRGGVMGFGSRRVMALGVPLMALLSVSQFRAVLVHEFGHYSGGDTRLGPWIYKTRAAIWRTLFELSRRDSWLLVLFKWYGNIFLKITLAISRAQEYAADRLAAQVAGRRALIEGLKQLHRGTIAWQPYVQGEVLPVLNSGYAPPLARGLTQFLQATEVKALVEKSLREELAEGKAHPLDSHPALPQRIAALEGLPDSVGEDTRLATDLLVDFESCDTGLFGPIVKTPLKPVKWEQVLAQVWIPRWQEVARYQRNALQSMIVEDVPEQFANGALAKRIKNPPGLLADFDQRVEIATHVVGCALSLALLQDGWVLHAALEEMYCENNGQRLEPFQLVQKLVQRELTAQQWKDLCNQAGISKLPLSAEVVAGSDGSASASAAAKG